MKACDLGPLAYRDGLALQEALVQARASGETGDWLLFPEHPPVLTVGRGASEGSLKADPAMLDRLGIELFEVARGGDITWHGPGQLVGYTILDLDARGRDLHRFLRQLEETIEAALHEFGIVGHTVPGRTGVWVDDAKICSIGIAVRRWVSYHGFALNVAPDLGFFDLIHPCGLRGIRMTSIADLKREAAPTLDQVRRVVARELAAHLGHDELEWVSPEEAWKFVDRAREMAESR